MKLGKKHLKERWNKEEYLAMIEWGLQQDKHPVVIRIPGNAVVSTKETIEPDFYNLNTYKKRSHESL